MARDRMHGRARGAFCVMRDSAASRESSQARQIKQRTESRFWPGLLHDVELRENAEHVETVSTTSICWREIPFPSGRRSRHASAIRASANHPHPSRFQLTCISKPHLLISFNQLALSCLLLYRPADLPFLPGARAMHEPPCFMPRSISSKALSHPPHTTTSS